MISLEIPGMGAYSIEHVVCDFTGTLSVGGELLPGIPAAIHHLSEVVEIHVVTADTMSIARPSLGGLPCRLTVLDGTDTATGKLRYVEALDPSTVVAVGNGRNDRLILERAALGIAVMEGEGCALDALTAADIVVRCGLEAFELLINPDRLKATLRG